MSLANKLTIFRIILAPVFFVFYQLPKWSTSELLRMVFPSLRSVPLERMGWTAVVLWLIFLVAEFTDLFDGLAARKLNQTSDLGKLLDPFADTIMQITCFLCFAMDGLLPLGLVLIVIYRELSILMIRNLMMKKGITLAARMSGKTKTVSYIIAAGAALFVVSFERLKLFEEFAVLFIIIANIIFFISVIISIVSFIDYCLVYRKAGKNNQ